MLKSFSHISLFNRMWNRICFNISKVIFINQTSYMKIAGCRQNSWVDSQEETFTSYWCGENISVMTQADSEIKCPCFWERSKSWRLLSLIDIFTGTRVSQETEIQFESYQFPSCYTTIMSAVGVCELISCYSLTTHIWLPTTW